METNFSQSAQSTQQTTNSQPTNIRGSYLVRIHTDKVLPEYPTDRLAVISFKATKENGGNKPATRSVSLPAINIQVQPAVLAGALTDAFHSLQDSRIRELIVEQLEANPNSPSFQIPAHELTPESIAAWNSQKSSGERLTKEDLNNWYDNTLSDYLLAALTSAVTGGTNNPTDDQMSRILGAMDQHKKAISALAAPKPNLPENVRNQLLKAVQLAPQQDRTRNKLIAKLTATSEQIILDSIL